MRQTTARCRRQKKALSKIASEALPTGKVLCEQSLF